MERSLYISQFQNRGYFREIFDQPQCEITFEESQEETERIWKADKVKKVNRIIDVSDGIKNEDHKIFDEKKQLALAKYHKHSKSTNANSNLLYSPRGQKLLQERPNFGQSKLANLDISRLPELNMKNQEQHFKRVKKHLDEEKDADDNGPAIPV